jgi:hypothetical protein
MFQMYQHQQEAVNRLWHNPNYALLMEMGTGKSRCIIEDWLNRVNHGLVDDLVVIAPKGMYFNWIGSSEEPGEIVKWIEPDSLPRIRYVPWISGANKTHQKALDDLLYAKGPRFMCMNIEALNRPGNARKYLLDFVARRRVIGVIDESTMIAHESAARTKWLLENAWRFQVRRILSGLVVPESPMDSYSQYHFLDWKILGQKSFWGFRNRYAITEKVDFTPRAHKVGEAPEKQKLITVITGYRNQEELHNRMMQYSYRVTKNDVLDLPPKIYQFWDVELAPEQRRIYDQMKNVAMAKLSADEYSTAKIKLDQLSKMQHILCGHVRKEDGTLADIPEQRTDAVIEILHNHTGKAIIWAPYPYTLTKIRNRIAEEFGDDSVIGYWGETTLTNRLVARDRIQNDDLCRFIVSNQSVGKFGNTWTACNLVIYYANSFDQEDRQQSEDRAHRIGQTKYVTYIDIRAQGTMDDKLIRALRKKMDLSATLMGDKFKEWLI